MLQSAFVLVSIIALFTLAPGATPPITEATIPPWGIDLMARDPSVRPGEDFYHFANGHWLSSTKIPEDQTSWDAFAQLRLEAQRNVQIIIQSLPATPVVGSLEQKIGDYYRAYVDIGAIERAGLGPARTGLAAIEAARNPIDIARLMGRPDLGLYCPLGVGISIDAKNPDRYVVMIGQSGLGLPQRDYYLKDDSRFIEIRQQYRTHIAKMLALAGESDTPSKSEAGAILALETEIAKVHWPIEKRRERDLTYNLRSYEQLLALAPNFPWSALLAAGGIDHENDYVVAELDAVAALGQQFSQFSVATWKSYLKYHYLTSMAGILPQALDEERFDFYERKLNGQEVERKRWKRAVDATGEALGEAVGQLYVQRYFPPASKAMMLDLVENLRSAYVVRIQAAPWMSEATKKVALEKLAAFRLKIAYPDKWRDYSSLEIRPGDAFGNAVRASVFDYERDLKRLHQSTDRDEWGMTPQTVNAYYDPTFNEIVFPAAILQPPFFDPKADAAVNYGAIGAVIGHEMSHGFDDQGAKSDARGVLRTWWKLEDEHAFKGLGDRLADQYSSFTALPGLKLNGRLTLGENLGDLGGVTVALEAYRLSLHGRAAAALDGLFGDQRFFLSWAQLWRTLQRDEALRTQVLSDPHSPAQFRVNGVVRNTDAWYAAFDVKPGDPLYVPPAERVRVW